MAPYRIIGMLGGIRMPRVPPAATVPSTTVRLYPRDSISGIAIAPMVTAVATLEPEIAAKIAQAKTVATPRPPGK